MKLIIEKYIGKEAFEEKFQKISGNKEFEEVFTFFLVNFLTELEEDNAIEEDDTPATLLDIPNDYIDCYIENRKNGFSKVWSKTQAELKIMRDLNNTVIRCYEEVASSDKHEALKDLQVFCKLKNGDKRYTDFLIDYVINNGYSERPVEEIAADFSRTYRKQLEKGKSEIYADKYASLIAEDYYHEIYCEDYAFIYDQALTKGKSEEYAKRYAEKYASELVDVKRRAGIADDEESLEFAKAKAKAYINGWEYATTNSIQEKSGFIDCYSNCYLNTFFSDNINEWSSIEQCEEIVLRKTLEKFESAC
ncbi:hypothetical protein APR41_05220 [Salegentibacter salinarum]|uniref:Uncharacterized protein n=1 Tax=Salegentibacter salinarum TaxID=447422 RepID=A0A2N0TS93_9FLAO|nr:hypothetical protein [Salegentibacter salinarum]PKD17612.1 hypothetical protein APR41_05220 [Salegentibacter salinarum]SKB49647.1 hypothetical protein SAMN05660903_01069 [Salegentibacter salinarum]